MSLSVAELQALETIIRQLPRIAKALEDLKPEQPQLDPEIDTEYIGLMTQLIRAQGQHLEALDKQTILLTKIVKVINESLIAHIKE